MDETMWSDVMNSYLTENTSDHSQGIFDNVNLDFTLHNLESGQVSQNQNLSEQIEPTYENQGTVESVIQSGNGSSKQDSQINQNTVKATRNTRATAKKTCRVCGDKAIGHNFNVVTCESCKAFFRRNASKKKELECKLKTNDCPINVSSRRRCAACRLTKCFQIGMMPEYIMTDEEKMRRNRRAGRSSSPGEEHRTQDQASGACHPEYHTDQINTSQAEFTMVAESTPIIHEWRMVTRQHGLESSFDQSTFQSNDTVQLTIHVPTSALFNNIFNRASTSDDISNIQPSTSSSLLDTDSLDLDALDSLAVSMGIHSDLPILSPFSLSIDLKLAKLDELFMAIDKRKKPDPAPSFPRNGGNFTAIEYYNLMYYNLCSLIRILDNCNTFKQLHVQDQISLLKSGFLQFWTLARLYSFDGEREILLFRHKPDQEYVDLALLKRLRGGAEYHAFKALVTLYPEKWRLDTALMVILYALVLFDPDNPHLVNSDAVEAERQVYLQLLKDYLDNRYGIQESRRTYKTLLEHINNLRSYTKMFCARINFELNPRTLGIMSLDVLDFS